MNPIPVIIIAFAVGIGVADVHAQLGIGQPAVVKSVAVTIEGLDEVSVVHEVLRGGSTRSLELIEGTASDIKITDEGGNDVQHGVSGGFGGTTVTIFPTSENVLVTYDLSDVMFARHGTTWTWDFLYPVTTTFYLPDSADLVFVNNRPVYLQDEGAFNCHGCEMLLEFVPDEKKTTKTVSWEDREFEVEVWASTELNSFEFNQPQKSLSYDFEDSERWVTLVIPQELLWNPYQALSNGKKIPTYEFGVDENRHGISLKLNDTQSVSIVGTSVIPEFPLVVPIMVAGITMIMALQLRGRIILR